MSDSSRNGASEIARGVNYEVQDHLAYLTMDRPDARNAVDPAFAAAMEMSIDQLEADDAVWVGLVAARGPVFSAGADLKAIAAGRAEGIFTRRGGFAGICRRERRKPLIAVVEGPALAGGCEIVLSCDLVVASSDASFGIPEVSRSLVAAGGGLLRLGRRLPVTLAMEMALTGAPISAERAYAGGLVNNLTESGAALNCARALALKIVANAPLAVYASRRVVAEGTFSDEDEAWRMSRAALREVRSTEDFIEGPLAFVEKRAPIWAAR